MPPTGTSPMTLASSMTGMGQSLPRSPPRARRSRRGRRGRRRRRRGAELLAYVRDRVRQHRQEPVDVLGRRTRWQRDPDVALAQDAHRLQDMARGQRAARAGGAGGDGETRPVQFVQERLPVDVQAGEGDDPRETVNRVPDHLDVRDQFGHPYADPFRQFPQARGLRDRLRPYRAQRRRRGHDGRDVLEARRPPRLPLVHGPLGSEPHPLAHDEQSDPEGPPHLWALAVNRDQSPSTRRQGSDCAASTNSGTPPPGTPPRPPAPAAPCPPRGWRTGGTRARCRGAGRRRTKKGRRCPRGRRAPSSPSRPPPRGPLPNGVPTSVRQLTRSGGVRRAGGPPAHLDPGVHRPGARRGEGQLVRAAPHRLGRRLARRVEQQPGPPPLPVEPRGIGPPSSSEACRACRATGWRGAAEAASK